MSMSLSDVWGIKDNSSLSSFFSVSKQLMGMRISHDALRVTVCVFLVLYYHPFVFFLPSIGNRTSVDKAVVDEQVGDISSLWCHIVVPQ